MSLAKNKMNQEFLSVFIEESREELDKIEQLIISLESTPNNPSSIAELMRLFHTLKGNARMMEITDFSDASHIMEDCLKAINDGTLNLSPAVTDFILKGKDTMKNALSKLSEMKATGIDTAALTKGFEELKTTPGIPAGEVKVELETPQINAQNVRVPTESLDKVLRCVGQLNTKLSTFKSLQESFDEKLFNRNVRETEQLLKELQEEVLDERMFPLETIFSRYPRMVREIALEQGKKINLVIKSTDVKLDKSVLDIINDPMVHILRNAVDHGIEIPDERKKKGKGVEGTVEISTEKLRDSVIVNIRDDGKGIDTEAILKKAIEMGYVAPGNVLSNEKILQLVGKSGLSTKSTASKLSGRGVGMDIVFNNLKRIGGNMSIKSEKDKGTLISLRLPLTLAIVNSIMVSVNEQAYAVPLLRVLKIMELSKGSIRHEEGKCRVQFEGKVIAYFSLGELLGITHEPSKILIYEYGNELVALGVDEILSREFVLVNRPDPRLASIPGIGGTTIMEDGSIRVFLDIESLLKERD